MLIGDLTVIYLYSRPYTIEIPSHFSVPSIIFLYCSTSDVEDRRLCII